MAGPTRREPPELTERHLTRSRLLAKLDLRWRHRLTTIVAGAGFGKTSLMAEAVARSRDAPDCRDVWVTCEMGDATGESLLAELGEALGVESAELATIVRVVWHLAPTHVCFVFDDAHEIRRGSSGAVAIGQLIDQLPRNGHIVLASRSAPPFSTAALAAQGQLVRLTEADLVFDADELEMFAARRGVEVRTVASSGGWPALAELGASAASDLVGEYVWQEVLDAVGPERASGLALLAVIGEADDETVVAVGYAAGIHALTEGVPLVSWTREDGVPWATLHPLWVPVLRPLLAAEEVRRARRSAGYVHRRRGRLSRAIELFAEAGEWDEVLGTVQMAASSYGAFEIWHRFARWRGLLPSRFSGHPVALLAEGIAVAAQVPADAGELFRRAAAGFRDAGDAGGELAAILKHGLVAWWANDVITLLSLSERAGVLADAGHAEAALVSTIGQAAIAHALGDPGRVLELVDGVDLAAIGEWAAPAAWLRTVAHRRLGDLDRAALAQREAELVVPGDLQLAIAQSRVDWLRGEVDRVPEVLGAASDHYRTARNRYLEVESRLELAARLAWLGDRHAARGHVDDVAVDGESSLGALVRVLWAISAAASAIDAGDDAEAARILHNCAEAKPSGPDHWYWIDRGAVALVHVLCPGERGAWERLVVAPVHRSGIDLAVGLEAARAGDRAALRRLTWPSLGVARAHLPLAWLRQLVRAATAAGNPPPAELVEFVAAAPAGPILAGERPRPLAAAAGSGAQPPGVELLVLGPVRLVRDGAEVSHSDLRRRRVRELLAALALGRARRREELGELLWPDMADPLHNLRVTLGYLHRVLVAIGMTGAVVADRRTVHLADDPSLRCDLWELETLLDQAERAERTADPARALAAYDEALPLWSGDFGADLVDVEWISSEQVRLRRRYVTAAVRAGELHLAGDRPDLAASAGYRAVSADRYDEPAHALVMRAHLASGDVGRARAAVTDCLAALADCGVPPAPATALVIEEVGRSG